MPRKPRLLIVEDEPAIQAGLVDVFVFHGYEVEAVADGRTALARALGGRFDLVVLDVMLPGMDGFAVCEAIRATDREQAIIMLTARSGDDDIVNGLRLGADDYVSKPFGVQELVLRVAAVLRRTRGQTDELADFAIDDGARVDVRNLCGEIDGRAVVFTRREMDLLAYLYRQRERAVPREELLHAVWGHARHVDVETRTVDIHVAKLRRKLEADPAQPVRLITVRGAGYRLPCVGR